MKNLKKIVRLKRKREGAIKEERDEDDDMI